MNIFKKIYRKYFQTKKSKIKELSKLWNDVLNIKQGNKSIFAYTAKNKYYIVLMYKTFSLELVYNEITEATKCLLNNMNAFEDMPDLFEILILKNGKEVLPYENEKEDFFPDIGFNPDDYYPLDEDDF